MLFSYVMKNDRTSKVRLLLDPHIMIVQYECQRISNQSTRLFIQ